MEKDSNKKDSLNQQESSKMDYDDFVFNPYDLNSVATNCHDEKLDTNQEDYNPYDLSTKIIL